MLSGLIIVLLPLLLGYLVPVRDAHWQTMINHAVNGSVYVILLLMGVSLAGLENLSSQLSVLGGHALLLFTITTLFNLSALWWLSLRLKLKAGVSPVVKNAPTSKLAAMQGSLLLVVVVAAGVILGLLLGPSIGETLLVCRPLGRVGTVCASGADWLPTAQLRHAP